jgi:hypothetical protein
MRRIESFVANKYIEVGSVRSREEESTAQLTRARNALRFEVCGPQEFMAEVKIQVGQVWKNTETGKSFLVTRLYTEALATFAVLRSTDDDKAPPVKIRVTRTKQGSSLPGYVPAQSFEAS